MQNRRAQNKWPFYEIKKKHQWLLCHVPRGVATARHMVSHRGLRNLCAHLFLLHLVVLLFVLAVALARYQYTL